VAIDALKARLEPADDLPEIETYWPGDDDWTAATDAQVDFLRAQKRRKELAVGALRERLRALGCKEPLERVRRASLSRLLDDLKALPDARPSRKREVARSARAPG
jgi:hypothetical protein